MDNQDLVFARVPLSFAQADIAQLAIRHDEEVRAAGAPALEIDWDLFHSLEGMNKFHLFIAKDQATAQLAGYVMHIIHRNTHRAVLQAVDDCHYLAPEYRKGWNAARFLRYVEGYLKAAGVRKISYHTKARLGKSPFFDFLGYTAEDIIHEKYL